MLPACHTGAAYPPAECPAQLPLPSDFFTLGVQFVSELRITMRRLGDFLSLPEPPEPWHARAKATPAADGAPAVPGSSKAGRRRSSDAAKQRQLNGDHGVPNGSTANGTAAGSHAGAAEAAPAVEVTGADFDWADRSWAEPAGGAAAACQPAAAAAAAAAPAAKPAEAELAAAGPGDAKVAIGAGGDAAKPAGSAPGSPRAAADGTPGSGFQLRHLQFEVPRGQLVGIVGAVGSGEAWAA